MTQDIVCLLYMFYSIVNFCVGCPGSWMFLEGSSPLDSVQGTPVILESQMSITLSPGCSSLNSAPCQHLWKSSNRCPKFLGPSHPHGRPGWSSQLLAFTWPTCGPVIIAVVTLCNLGCGCMVTPARAFFLAAMTSIHSKEHLCDWDRVLSFLPPHPSSINWRENYAFHKMRFLI